MEVKEKHWLILFAAVVIALCGYMYWKKTAPERKYKWEIRQLQLMRKHQALEIQVTNQRITLAEMKKEAEKKIPSYNLTPQEPKE